MSKKDTKWNTTITTTNYSLYNEMGEQTTTLTIQDDATATEFLGCIIRFMLYGCTYHEQSIVKAIHHFAQCKPENSLLDLLMV